ncbi:MAG: class I SAM-dependent methyltransferase [Chloroflexi bacterium]|nr:class I SAM-dependent methyltransferase [Chloroflexota bacterium]
MIPSPFDPVAADYDTRFTDTRLGRLLRQAVWDVAGAHFRPGMRVLEIGCGTGEDAVWLAGRGVRVVATDASAAMVTAARAKAAQRGVAGLVEVRQMPGEDLVAADLGGPFDGLFSNFGVLNCVDSPSSLVRGLAAMLRPGGSVVVVVMGPLCPWEVVWQLAHGRPDRAFRRLRPGGVTATIGGLPLRVCYPSARSLIAAFCPAFRVRTQVGLGILLPPTEAAGLVDRWPGLFDRLARWERRIAGWAPLRSLGDHYVLVLERTTELPRVT